MRPIQPERLLRAMLDAAIKAADPSEVLAQYLPEKPKGRCIVVGAGKCAASMARAVERAWPDVDLSGMVVTRYGHVVRTERVEVREAAHPVPDVAGAIAAQEIIDLAGTAGPEDLVLALISGGGSALLPMAKPPVTFGDLVEVNRRLLASGLSINAMNSVRRRLSLINGGGLMRAVRGARLVTLAISDVPGDAPAAIASGPTVADPTAGDDLSHLVDRLGPDLSAEVRRLLSTPCAASQMQSDFRLIATPQLSLEAAARIAEAAGITPVLLGDALEGEARELGTMMSGIAASVAKNGTPVAAPAVLISGGETTVTIKHDAPGRGGRNTEFLLSLAMALEGNPRITALAADTDGIDGTEPAAGAIIDPDVLSQAAFLGISPREHLEAHDSFTVFERLSSLVVTGPTLTNINDFRAILVT